jgi:hypothetical protein
VLGAASDFRSGRALLLDRAAIEPIASLIRVMVVTMPRMASADLLVLG